MLPLSLNTEQKRLLVVSGICFSAHLAVLFTTLQPKQTRADALTLTMPLTQTFSVNLARLPTATVQHTAVTPQANIEPITTPKESRMTPKIERHQPTPNRSQQVKKTKKAEKTQKPQMASPAPVSRLSTTEKTSSLAKTADSAIPPAPTNNNAGTFSSHSETYSSYAAPRFRVPPEPPTYPQTARQRKQEGTAIIEVSLDASGSAARISLVRSSGFPLLDRAALQAVKRWQFLPKQINGKGIAHNVRIPVRFQLT